MMTGEGWITEIYHEQGGAEGRIRCAAGLRPAPGQYVMAVPSVERTAPPVLAVALFPAGWREEGFDFAGPIPEGWQPGMRLALRGPLGRGFQVPREARRAALAALADAPVRVTALIPGLLTQGVEVVLLAKPPLPDLPEAVEVQPLDTLEEVSRWADYLALEVSRESLPELRGRLKSLHVTAEVLVRVPMPCGAMAECGVCAVQQGRRWKLACKDGPVFDWRELGESRGPA